MQVNSSHSDAISKAADGMPFANLLKTDLQAWTIDRAGTDGCFAAKIYVLFPLLEAGQYAQTADFRGLLFLRQYPRLSKSKKQEESQLKKRIKCIH